MIDFFPLSLISATYQYLPQYSLAFFRHPLLLRHVSNWVNTTFTTDWLVVDRYVQLPSKGIGKQTMNVGIAQGDHNPNSSWLNSRGVWLTYIILVFVLHFILLSIPYISTPVAWTLTTTIHNIVSRNEWRTHWSDLLVMLFVLVQLLFISFNQRCSMGNEWSRSRSTIDLLGANRQWNAMDRHTEISSNCSRGLVRSIDPRLVSFLFHFLF